MKKIFNLNHGLLRKSNFEIFSGLLEDLNKINSEIIIGLSGGTSVNGFYNYILQNSENISQDIWQKIKFCFLDERLVSLEHEDSNYNAVYNNFFKDLLEKNYIKSSQIIKIDILEQDFLKKINTEIKNIDIALLGVGPDGHVCSLFPHHEGLKNDEFGYILIDNSPKPPSQRISISKKFLGNIKNIFIYFIGESKKGAYTMFLDKKSFEDCPATIVWSAENLNVISDIK